MNSRPSLFSTVLLVGSVIVVSAVLWLVIFTNIGDAQKSPRIEMLLELSKVLVQLGLVTALGATVTFLYNLYAKEQEQYKFQLQEDNKLRRELLDSLIAVRAQIEKTRREFRLLPVNEKKVGYHCAIQNSGSPLAPVPGLARYRNLEGVVLRPQPRNPKRLDRNESLFGQAG